MVSQKAANYSTPYKFTSKELDEETGLYYFGARYYDSRLSIWHGVDPLADKFPNLSPYVYVANNPLRFIDPDGRTIIPVHGTWSNPKTWENMNLILEATNNLFGDNFEGGAFDWSGGNYAIYRSVAAIGLIDHIRGEMKSENYNGEITLVGHSHGGNVSIEALNIMADMDEFNDVQFNLLTINTPVRDDYQLSENASARVNHVNVYDPKDPVQSNGGNAAIINNPLNLMPAPNLPWGEYGKAGRTFLNAKNLEVNNPQAAIQAWYPWGGIPIPKQGDWHNSHNRVSDWIDKTQNK